MAYQDIDAIPWQEEVNQYGGVRRYRMIGGIKEYEMMVTVDGTEVPQSELNDYHERNKAIQLEEMKKTKTVKPPARFCPLASGLQNGCTGQDCALYLNGCALAQISGRPPAKDTAGLTCPISTYKNKCRADCALYRGGCALTGIKKESEDK